MKFTEMVFSLVNGRFVVILCGWNLGYLYKILFDTTEEGGRNCKNWVKV